MFPSLKLNKRASLTRPKAVLAIVVVFAAVVFVVVVVAEFCIMCCAA